jgi:hypothetical protein
MSQKKDPTAQAIEGAASLIGKGLFAAAAGTTALIAKKLQVPPEEQLRKLGSPPVWGQEIVAVPCNTCETLNETDAEICFHCGSAINYKADSESNPGEQIIPSEIKSKLNESIKLPDGWRWW